MRQSELIGLLLGGSTPHQHHNYAARLLSMVFIPVSCKTPGKTNHNDQTPCLAHLKLKQADEGIFTLRL